MGHTGIPSRGSRLSCGEGRERERVDRMEAGGSSETAEHGGFHRLPYSGRVTSKIFRRPHGVSRQSSLASGLPISVE
jgi:hypothetical protein